LPCRHHHALAAGVEPAAIELRHRVAKAFSVRRGEVGHGGNNAREPRAGYGKSVGIVDAGGDENGVVPLAQIFQPRIAANLEIRMKFNARSRQQPDPALHDALLELEVGNAVHEKPPDAVIAVVDMDGVTQEAHLFGCREAGWAAADDADRAIPLAPRPRALDPAPFPGRLGDVILDSADRHGAVARALDHAVAFAEPVLGTDAAADLGHVVGRGGEGVRFLEAPLGDQLEPVRHIVVKRAVYLAERDAALRAARGLAGAILGAVLAEDLLEISPTVQASALRRHGQSQANEFQHLVRHARALQLNNIFGERYFLARMRIQPRVESIIYVSKFAIIFADEMLFHRITWRKQLLKKYMVSFWN
jgi:hypothetical protein